MKILLLGFAKIKYMPYLHFYLDHIPQGHEIHVVYWNRDKKPEDISRFSQIHLHEFACYQEDNVSPILKVVSFAKYRRFVKGIFDSHCFDFVICLHTFPCVLMQSELRTVYKDRYIFDYRDSTYEHFAPFRKLIGGLVADSYATFVSSDGFRKLLPASCESKIYTSHNLLLSSLAHRAEMIESDAKYPKLRIGFWGYIREEKLNKHLIACVAKDQRFELHYYGKEQLIAQRLKQFAAELNAENVCFHGEYSPEERYEFAKNTDLLHNLYEDPNMMMAVSNKYYDGLLFYLPQICTKESVMGEKVDAAGVGITCYPYSDTILNDLWDYYHGLNRNVFADNCDKTLNRILCEYHTGRKIIEDALENK